MQFDIVSTIYYMKLSISNNKEIFTRDSFSIEYASYNKDNDTYTILRKKDEFKTKKEYKKYLSNYSNSLCKLYKSNFVSEANELGTLLLKFVNYDFTDFNYFVEFVREYGIPAIDFYDVNKGPSNPFNKYINLNITNDKKNIFLSEKDFIIVCKKIFEKRKKILIKYQSEFKKLIYFINNISNLDYLNDFSIADRFYIYKYADYDYIDLYLELSQFITLSYDIEPIKNLTPSSLCHTKNSFEENAKNIAQKLKKDSRKYENDIFSALAFNCHTIETACLITLLELIKHDTSIYVCKNCGKHFIPSSKKNTLYCNNIYEHGKTCQEIGAMITYNDKLKKDEVTALYRKTLSAKKMLANRNPDIPVYLEKYEKWKEEANKFKQDIKNGLKTEEQFKQWIEETRKKY